MRLTALLLLALAGCRVFSDDLQTCIDAGRCGASGGGSAGGTAGGSGGGSAGGTAGGGGSGGGATATCVSDAGFVCATENGRSFFDLTCDVGGPAPALPRTCAFDGGDVLIRRFDVHVFPDGLTRSDPSTQPPLRVWRFNGGTQSFERYDVEAVDAGTWVARGIPAGDFLVETASTAQSGRGWLLTCERSLDLSAWVTGEGRPDISAGGTTILVVDAGNLEPWATTDDLQMSSPQGGLGWKSLIAGVVDLDDGGSTKAGPLPTAGATQATFELSWEDTPIHPPIDKGELVVLFQLSSGETDSGVVIRQARRSATTTSPNVQPGGTGYLAATLLPVTPLPGDRLQVLVNREAFANAYATTGNGPHQYEGLAIDPSPGGAHRGVFGAGGSPDIMTTNFKALGGGTAPFVDGGTWLDFVYGNPFPPAWGKVVIRDVGGFIPVASQLIDDGGMAFGFGGQAVRTDYDTALFPGPVRLRPMVEPATRLTVNGYLVSGATAVNSDGITSIEWTPPAGGCRPTEYQVSFRRMRLLENGGANAPLWQSISVPGDVTFVRLPAGALTAVPEGPNLGSPIEGFVVINAVRRPRVRADAPLFVSAPGFTAQNVFPYSIKMPLRGDGGFP